MMTVNPWHKRAILASNETAGVWITFSDYPGWKFKVGRDCAWNENAARAIARVSMQPKFKAAIERAVRSGGELDAEDAALDREYKAVTFAEGLLLDWSGVTDETGKAMKKTTKNAVRLFEHFPDIYTALQAAARDERRFLDVAPDPTADEAGDAIEGN